ncbi:hypothetical protein E1180_10555 [Roseibium denhamense]|uniref:Flagellar biosynthesis protein, FliO n=1 Tax=Roseibium denhamense TaxID=76305 RepID=A0ABY1N8R7_9HYPH|nr:flagellar biosynthetic protein FliO [Roseibium denhamense]MTI05952.1 hypothetical protein [Roseibium denhamense]SMP02803.1 Flagellar biosynthesis protein, FliO [Roseibium denhamense]
MYDWIESTFNVSGSIAQGLALIISLAVVLALFGLFIFIIKRLMGASSPQGRSRQPRIGVMDTATVDTRRRLILVRRDNVEHLILIGGPSDVVVEQNIIRHAPLPSAQGRQNSGYPVQQTGAAAPLKAPLAPGPDIPVTPDGSHPSHPQTAPTTAPSSASVAPVAPEPPAQPPRTDTNGSAAPTRLPPAETSTKPAPQAAWPKTAPLTAGASPSAKAFEPPRSPSIPPAPPTYKKPEPPKVETKSPPVKAPGFDQTPPVAAPPKEKAADKPAAQMGQAAVKAETEPSAKPAKSPLVQPVAAAAQTAARAGSALSSLARPFSPKDRPSYGTHSISPPASGPAARAKTARLKPVEQAAPADRIEPALSTPAPTPAVDTRQSNDAEGQKSGTPDTTPEAVDAAATPPAAPVGGTPEGSQDSKASEPAKSAEPVDDSQGPASIDPSAKTGEVSGETSEADTALEDLLSESLEEQLSADQPSEASGPANRTAGERKPSEDKASDEIAAPVDMGEESEVSGSKSEAAQSAGTQGQAEKDSAVKQNAQGLGDRNPIEEEMAKILDELGGQPKQ